MVARLLILAVLIVGVVFAMVKYGAQDRPLDGKTRDRQVLQACMDDMRDEMRSAAFRESARSMCERFRDDFARKHGHQP